MSVNHKPATPLPWTVLESGEELQDHAYKVHAANAYPLLVEALRKARTMAAAGAPRAAGNPHLMNPSDAEQIAKFDALLREIGEA